MKNISELDGWRGISILLVLAAHLLPLGPKFMQLNGTAGAMGMALFFTLSGFLITSFLLKDQSIIKFLIRRFTRIIPLAWLYLFIMFLFVPATPTDIMHNFLFTANLGEYNTNHFNTHFWSLCVEMQFYIGIALVIALFKEKGFIFIPVFCIAITLYRVDNQAYVNTTTLLRLDEILAGGILAMVSHGKLGDKALAFLGQLNPFVMFALFFISSHPESEWANYFRPYFAAMLVGSTMYNKKALVNGFLSWSVLKYVAAISYALYVIHGGLRYTWLGEGADTLEKYLKRPLLFAVIFGLAHISTFYYERKVNDWGRKFSNRFDKKNLTKEIQN
ncbi:acyltransferase [Aliikangiella marina]|uniref:Acyltransferase n=1 Tax=Aliikangiella marina TaxID=1712262 RepID=A0A545TBL3_9GAMM|nr:acyltransferase [Aliikangiella marina]TQV74605.1 acyltransferase [Aliikangiella marina]